MLTPLEQAGEPTRRQPRERVARHCRSDTLRRVNREASAAPVPRRRAETRQAAGGPDFLAAADSAWLRVDRDDNHMIITAVLVLDHAVPFATLQKHLDLRLQPYPRLRRRIVAGYRGWGPPRWEDDPDYDIRRQTESSTLPEPADRRALEAFVGGLMHRALDPTRPRWRIHYVPAFSSPGSPDGRGAALVVRVHHCMADGIALLRVLMSLCDEPPEIAFPTAAASWARPASTRAALPAAAREIRRAAAGITHFLGFLLRPGDPETRFRRPLSGDKCAAWSNAIPLAEIKRIAGAFDASVNEVLLCAAAGAVGRVLADDHEFRASLVLRGVVPVNLRLHEEVANLGNRFGLVFMPMHVGNEDPHARLQRVRRDMAAIRASPEALGWFAILRALGRVPAWIEALGVELFSRKASMVVTSLAGPQDELHLCGAEIAEVMFWVPSAGKVGLGLSMLSYRGTVQLGVASDASQLAEPHRLADAFEAEVAALAATIPGTPVDLETSLARTHI